MRAIILLELKSICDSVHDLYWSSMALENALCHGKYLNDSQKCMTIKILSIIKLFFFVSRILKLLTVLLQDTPPLVDFRKYMNHSEMHFCALVRCFWTELLVPVCIVENNGGCSHIVQTGTHTHTLETRILAPNLDAGRLDIMKT